jgi:GWxTD domain-containing protein
MRRFYRMLYGWAGLIGFLLVRPFPGHAQTALPEFSGDLQIDPIYAVIDILTMRGDTSDSTRVDCYYRLSNELLNFIRSNERYVGHYELSLVIMDDDGFQMLGETIRDSVVVNQESATHNMDPSRAQLFTTYLPPGEYKLELKLLDIESSKQMDLSRGFVVPDYFHADLSVSDIQFAGLVSAEQSGLGLSRHGLTVIPNLTRSYGEEQTDMYIYYEVYSGAGPNDPQPLTATYRVKSPTGKILLTETEDLARKGSVGAYSQRFDTRSFSHGVYTLELEIQDRALKKTVKTRSEFNINWQYLLPLTNAKNYKEILDQLQLIASNDEMKELKKFEEANGPEQQQALKNFWVRHDPTPGTEQNETMITYYRRIEYANKNFTSGLGKGWRTDQGRIFILLGPPDEVERYSFEADSRPYQVWHYNRISRRFVFIDYDGFGRYHLYRIY